MSSVLVAGSINMDVVAIATRFPKIGETVAGRELHFFPGGKGANQAIAAAKSGAPTRLIGRLGEDAFGRDLIAFLASQGVDLQYVARTSQSPSGTAVITLADGDNTIVVVPGANGLLTAADVAAPAIHAGDVLVSQFEIPLEVIRALFARGRAAGARTILNPAPVVPFGRELLDLVDILVLNETELGALIGTEVSEGAAVEELLAHARALRRSVAQVVCVTLGKRGAIAVADNAPLVVPGHVVTPVDTTGAGDCFVGALAARLAGGAALSDALAYANRAAAVCVQRKGAGPSMPTLAEVEAALQ